MADRSPRALESELAKEKSKLAEARRRCDQTLKCRLLMLDTMERMLIWAVVLLLFVYLRMPLTYVVLVPGLLLGRETTQAIKHAQEGRLLPLSRLAGGWWGM
ncbi:hypothetical protein HYH03_013939 [Edaphochlamys debaryana]|uniref:Uncharacterized protein n=1 Tax=Edaphochlamys debaryana TaxID=47281 RepID=A0A835XM41_9CHLO|nr:hypothetical protein HYH03_013939 [Edaphochlamys debaryana]|eukprot:KAG2487367.1 hypothetical protein HYH03_013939 [Edaphochlamys debaryana]